MELMFADHNSFEAHNYQDALDNNHPFLEVYKGIWAEN